MTRLPRLTKFFVFAVPFITLLLSGCASMTPQQCKVADWRQVGFADGSQGERGQKIDEHAKACAEVGVKPDLNAYLQGRTQGLVSYCQPQNGFNVGRKGATPNIADCPPNLKADFHYEYNRGAKIHAIESDLSSANSRLDSNVRRYRQADERIGQIRKDLDKKDLPSDKRKDLLSEYDRLVDQKDKLQWEKGGLQREVEQQRQRLERALNCVNCN